MNAVSSPSERPIVTYASPPSFLTSPEWANIRQALRETHLPLRNLHWKPASRPSLRTIQQVEIDLRPLEMGSRPSVDQTGSARPSLGGEGGTERSMLPGSFLEKPFLNIFFVSCEDADTYKTTIRKQIKDWHSLVVSRKTQEWVIVLVMKPDPATGLARSSTGAGRLFKMGGTVLDKIRSDFNTNKRDRCVQLSRPSFPTPDDPSLWSDLISKIKDGIITSFDSRVTQREEEIKTSEGMRTLPGWNFCTFFILKESLANSFEGMNLYEDALIQYNELEASFFQVLKERNLSFFGHLGATAYYDDSASVLSTTTKPYRDLILANTISVFDFRVYVFARQGKLMARMGRLGEVLAKGFEFVRLMGRWLGENPDALAHNFIESWIYSSCMNIIETCQEWKLNLPPNNTSHLSAVSTGANGSTSTLNGEIVEKEKLVLTNKGELYQLARTQLSKLGRQYGHLPNAYPFSTHSSLSIVKPSPDSSSGADRPITRRDLVAALETKESFDVLFYRITEMAIECLSRVGKERSTLDLIGGLATLDEFRDRLPSAYDRYRALSIRANSYSWTPMEAFYLIRLLELHRVLSKPIDSAWVGRALSFLRALVKIGEVGRLAVWEGNGEDESDREKESGLRKFVDRCLNDIREAGKHFEKDLPVHDHEAFSVKLQSPKQATGPLRGQEDGCNLHLLVQNHLPCTVTVDDVRACLSGHELEQLWFTSGKTELKHGDNVVCVFCPMPVSGLFSLEVSQIRLSKVAFHYVWLPSKASDVSERTVVRIPRDYKALNARLTPALDLRLDSRPVVLLHLISGRNQVTKATVALQVTENELVLLMKEAQVISGVVATFSTEQDYLIVEGVQPDTTVVISVPYRGAPKGAALPQIRISVDYWTQTRPSQRRALRKTRPLDLFLPLSVNVHDIFREHCLLSKFTISSGGNQHLRVASANLAGAQKTLEIEGCRNAMSPMIHVTPNQPGNLLFRLTQKDRNSKKHDPLQMTIKYRILDDELFFMIQTIVSPLLASHNLVEFKSWLAKTMIIFIKATPGWANRFITAGSIDFPDVDENDIRGSCNQLGLGEEDFKKILDTWERAVEILDDSVTPEVGPDMPWRTLQIPVDMPTRQVISVVKLSLSTSAPYRVGQPLKCLVTITCSSAWSGGPMLEDLPMCYDLEVEFEHWLVSGRKRGTFVSKENEPFTATITLIPVHSGSLMLPPIQVTPSSHQSSPLTSAETYITNAAQSVEVLPMTGRATFVIGLSGDGPNKHNSCDSSAVHPNGIEV
ncbi:Putative transmembrane protein [Phaffia rhodozyma]|uniref:Putative transmembrane protein n=1 Tax=Phaffia rhodozyma TaxID=264483 RepID=A0A0F7SY83_PHARH|nr:Putative transmembrane protein [Phaffia rhodozyma]